MRRKSFSNIYKSLLGGALLAVLATGCNTEDFNSPSTDEKDAVIITAGAALSTDVESKTRAANTDWEADDLIGITMLSTSTPATPVYTNRQYKAASAGSGSVQFNPESESQKMYYPIDGSEVTFKSYYPYTGLSDYRTYPVNVSGQSDIARLDLMTAEHKNVDASTANSKNKKDAHLVFHHRLTMVTVNLRTETGSPIDLTDSKLVIKGMKTTGNYNLLTDVLTVDAGSVQDINISLSSTSTGRVGTAILLPREAAEGVVFKVATANGGVYTAAMESGLELKGGSKYTFNLTLKTTPALITASIEDWTEGPTRDYDVVNVIAGTGTNSGFEKDAKLKLYTKDQGTTEYSEGGIFTFNGTKWEKSGSPLFWESFTGPKVDFKATSTYAPALNSTQMPDYLVGKTTGVELYNGVHLEMKHVGTKVTVKLNSSDGTYTTTNLQGAIVILPQYLNFGSLNETTGEYTVGTGKGDITPEKQGAATPQDRVAIFPHQTIVAGTTLVKVVINEHVYEVKDASAFAYEQGKHHVISLNIKKSGVDITVSLKDWEKGGDHEAEVKIGTPSGTGTNSNIINGDRLYLFTEVTSGTREAVRGDFTYNGTTWAYSDASNPLFWEELPNTGKIYAQMERAAVNSTTGYNQSKDYIVATPVSNSGGTGSTGTRIDFNMVHAVAQVKVVLRSSDTYTADQLKTADIYLPGYSYDGSLDKGVYTPGTKTGTIQLDKPDNTEISTRSYLQAQKIPAGNTVARVVIDPDGAGGLPPRTYNVTYNHDVVYNAGEITHLYITIKGSKVLVSVKVTDWQDQTPVELHYSFNESPTSVTGFEESDVIKLYDLGNGTTVTDNKNYTVNTVGGKKELISDGTPWFRDDFANGDRIVGVYPSTASNITTGNTFSWNMTDKSDPTRENDILVAKDGIIANKNANVDLTFNHVLSKVTVNIISGTGFAPGEITGANTTVQLVGFDQEGTVNISTGAVTSTTNPQSFAPTSIAANTGATLSYQALVMPQTKGSDPVLVKVTLNGIEYDAKWTGSFQFKAGEHHILNITLAKTGLKLSAKIAGWVAGANGSITID